jgi:hypothetical protein
MRKAGILALLEMELGSGSESDIVDQVYRAMVRASRKPRSCTRELEKQDAIAESEGPWT